MNSATPVARHQRLAVSILLCSFSLTLFGTTLVNQREVNHLLLLALVMIGMCSYLVYLKIGDMTISFGIFILSLSLLFHRTLITNFIIGADVHVEYYWTLEAIRNPGLTMDSSHPYSTILSVQILYPIVVKVSGLPVTWFFKLVYPILFSFVPVTGYLIYRRFWTPSVSYLACILFMFNFLYFKKMSGLVRNGIAELLLALVILVLLSRRDTRSIPLFVILTTGIIITHYAITYFSVLLIGITLITAIAANKIQIGRVPRTVLTTSILFLLLAAFYYGIIFQSDLSKLYGIAMSALASFGLVSMPNAGSVHWATVDLPSVYHQAMRYLFYITQGSIVIGYLYTGYDKMTMTIFRDEEGNQVDYYYLLSGSIFILIFISVVFPALFGKGSFGFPRVYQISSLFIAPYGVIGAKKILEHLGQFVNTPSYQTAAATFLVIFLLFNANVVFEVAGVYSNSPSVSQDVLEGNGSIKNQIMVSSVVLTNQDVQSSQWLQRYQDKRHIYSDFWSLHNTLTSYGGLRYADDAEVSVVTTPEMSNRSNRVSIQSLASGYLYLRTFNTRTGLMVDYLTPWNIERLQPDQRNKIYASGGSPIYTVS